MNLICVYSGKTVEDFQSEGGIGYWIIQSHRAENAKYIICVRNRRESWAANDFKHGTAFLIGKISGVKDASDHRMKGRKLITISHYSQVNVSDAWKKLTDGQRYPVAYLNEETSFLQLGIDLSALEWEPFVAKHHEQESICNLPEDTLMSPILKAKHTLSKELGISEESIEIIIRS